jgi:shikimate dehydrogenase
MDAPSPYINLGLIGFPLEHSLSPILHQAALKAAGLQGEYRLYPLPPSPEGLQEIGALCQRIRSGTIKGLNVTIPHKQTVSRFVDRLTPIAEAVGAVNTLYLDKQGFLVGDNTDVPGFMRDISRLTDYAHGKAVVLGAGGSARAVVYGLSHACWDVLVLARRVEQAAMLVEEIKSTGELQFTISSGLLHPQVLIDQTRDCQLLVNTTPLGMYPGVGESPWPEDLPLPSQVILYDLIYNPLETCLLRRAREAGLTCANGAGMLAAQAALAFASWTGREPPFDVMERAFPSQLVTGEGK